MKQQAQIKRTTPLLEHDVTDKHHHEHGPMKHLPVFFQVFQNLPNVYTEHKKPQGVQARDNHGEMKQAIRGKATITAKGNVGSE